MPDPTSPANSVSVSPPTQGPKLTPTTTTQPSAPTPAAASVPAATPKKFSTIDEAALTFAKVERAVGNFMHKGICTKCAWHTHTVAASMAESEAKAKFDTATHILNAHWRELTAMLKG